MARMKTSCVDCEFRVDSAGVQTGCRLNFLDGYKRQGLAVLNGEAFEIDGRRCYGCYRKDADWPSGVDTPEAKESHVRELVNGLLRVKVIIPVERLTATADIIRSLRSVGSPDSVSIVYQTGTISSGDVAPVLKECFGEILWNLRCTPKNTEYGPWWLVYKEFEGCYPPAETHWVICEPGRELPADYIDWIHTVCFRRMEQLIYAEPAGGGLHGTVVSTAAYAAYAAEQQLVTPAALRAEGVPVHTAWAPL